MRTTARARILARLRGPRRRDDDGMAVSGVMIIVALAALVLLMTLVLPVMQSTANSGQAEDAADAAALAAAQRVRELALDGVPGLALGQTLGGALPASAGIERAATYADRNGGDLVSASYDLDLGRGRVEVEVLLRDEGEVRDAGPGRTQRFSTAEVGVALDRCSLDRRDEIIGYEPPPTPTATPTPSPSPTPDPTPTPTPTPIPIWGFSYRFVCESGGSGTDTFAGAWTLDRVAALAAGKAWLEDRLEPRLVR